MGYRPISPAKRARFGKVEANQTCDYCHAELSIGARIYRAPNGETYGIDCHKGRSIPLDQRPGYLRRNKAAA